MSAEKACKKNKLSKKYFFDPYSPHFINLNKY